MPAAPSSRTSSDRGLAVFLHPDFRLFQAARFCIILALEMQSVAVGWQIYATTRRALDLGLAGLAQFLPSMLLFLLSGHVADRFNRRNVIAICYLGFATCSALLFLLAWRHTQSVAPIYAVLVLLGIVRSFNGPVSRALLPQIVPTEHFPSAVAWASGVWQAATILGPAVGGVAYAAFHGPEAVYATGFFAALVALAATLRIKAGLPVSRRETATLQSFFAGIRYIWAKKLILGAISLDLFAVLLGGATALLPIYARDILKVGPSGLGLLRSAPAIGATLTGMLLGRTPLRHSTGLAMFASIAIFGVATIVFGLSTDFTASVAALTVLGASDMISVYVRSTLVQLATPDAMRGRVSAVNSLFIGASNELGEFESGLTAAWFGTVPSVVLGGVGTILVGVLWMAFFPALRKLDRLSDVENASTAARQS